jgi:hypothetical protein
MYMILVKDESLNLQYWRKVFYVSKYLWIVNFGNWRSCRGVPVVLKYNVGYI